ncbi:hypothetical protein V1506DRAFT_525513 [Lipomyces tetrasporus]
MEQDREEKKARSDALRGYAEVKRIEAQNAKAAARDFTSTSSKEVVVLAGQSICSQAVLSS